MTSKLHYIQWVQAYNIRYTLKIFLPNLCEKSCKTAAEVRKSKVKQNVRIEPNIFYPIGNDCTDKQEVKSNANDVGNGVDGNDEDIFRSHPANIWKNFIDEFKNMGERLRKTAKKSFCFFEQIGCHPLFGSTFLNNEMMILVAMDS